MVPGVHLREAACREIIGLSVSDQLERELVVTLVGQRELNRGPEIDYPNRVLLLPSFLFVFVILEFGCICLFVVLENEEPLRPVLSTSGITAQIEHALRQMRYVIRGNTMLPLSAPVTRPSLSAAVGVPLYSHGNNGKDTTYAETMHLCVTHCCAVS